MCGPRWRLKVTPYVSCHVASDRDVMQPRLPIAPASKRAESEYGGRRDDAVLLLPPETGGHLPKQDLTTPSDAHGSFPSGEAPPSTVESRSREENPSSDRSCGSTCHAGLDHFVEQYSGSVRDHNGVAAASRAELQMVGRRGATTSEQHGVGRARRGLGGESPRRQ
jgi:hypothetical protein